MINSINATNNQPLLEINNNSKKIYPQAFSGTIIQEADNISILNTQNKPVSFKEGMSLISEGFITKIKDMGKSIIQHPIKTIGAMLATSAALMALPFIGISMATGGAAIVFGFGLVAMYNTTKNLIHARKNSKDGNYAEMRNDLKKVGSNCVDLALTVPFMPKAFRQLKLNVPSYFNKTIAIFKNESGAVIARYKRYRGGTNIITYSKHGQIVSQSKNSLWSKIKVAKTWKERFRLLTSQDRNEASLVKLNDAFKKVAKERGVVLPEDLHYYNKPIEYTLKKSGFFFNREGGFNQNTSVHVNRNCLDLPKAFTRTNGEIIPVKSKKISEVVGHEFRHVEQNAMMSNAEGIKDRLKGAEWDYMRSYKPGTIKKGTPEYALAEKFYNAKVNYVQPEVNFRRYYNNALEVDARKVGETEIARQISDKYKQIVGVDRATNKLNPVRYNPTKDILTTDGLELSQMTEKGLV